MISITNILNFYLIFQGFEEYVKTSFTNLKYDIKHLSYVSESVQKMLENINNILEQGVTRNTNMIATNVLNNENIPIFNEETLQNFEILLESSTHRDKVVSYQH